MLTFAAGDPLSHVLDKSLHPFLDQIGLTKHVMMMLIATLICVFLFSRVAKGLAKQIETGESKGTLSSMLEAMLVFLRDDMVKPSLGDDTYRFLPLLWTYFFFIVTCNLLGLMRNLAGAGTVTCACCGTTCLWVSSISLAGEAGSLSIGVDS